MTAAERKIDALNESVSDILGLVEELQGEVEGGELRSQSLEDAVSDALYELESMDDKCDEVTKAIELLKKALE